MKNILLFILILAMVFHASLVYALKTSTHLGINELNARGTSSSGFSLDAYIKDQLKINDGIELDLNSKKIYNWIGEGGKLEDYSGVLLRTLNHFHNPVNDQGLRIPFHTMESSVLWSQKPEGTQSPGGHYSWYDAREYYYKALTEAQRTTREKNFADAFRGIGQVMHLLEDTSVPEHVRNDDHLEGSTYEKWISKNVKFRPDLGTYAIDDDPGTIEPYDVSLLSNPGGIPGAGLPITNLFDANIYSGSNPNVTIESEGFII